MQARVAGLEDKVAQLSQRVSELETDLSDAKSAAATCPLRGFESVQQCDPDANEQVRGAPLALGYPLLRKLVQKDSLRVIESEMKNQALDGSPRSPTNMHPQ